MADEGPGLFLLEEADRLLDHALVESVAQVHDGALADPTHQVGGEIGEDAFGEVENDDEAGDAAEVDVLDEDVVEDRFDEVGEARRRDAEAHHRQTGNGETNAVGPSLCKQATKLFHVSGMLSGAGGNR